MADIVKPRPAHKGEALTVAGMNKLRDSLLQRVRVTGGTARFVGNQLCLQVEPARGGEAGQSFLAKITACLTSQKCTVHKLTGAWPSGLTEDTEDLTAILPTGAFARNGMTVVIHKLEEMDPEWIVRDIVNWGIVEGAGGSYSGVTNATLAPTQFVGTEVGCEG